MSTERRIRQRRSFGAVYLLALVVALLLAAVPVFADSPPSENGIAPVEVNPWQSGDANVECRSQGFDFGVKWDYPDDSTGGTYPIGNGTVTWSTDGTYVSWESTFAIDAVIVKGGNAANVYVYDPESVGPDSELVSPDNKSGDPAGLSHVTFCYDWELAAEKTANAEYTRTYTWTIDKSVNPASHSGYAGENFSSDYDIVVDQTITDSDFSVSGSITVSNPTPFEANFKVTDEVGGVAATVDCPKATLAPGESAFCTYSVDLGDNNPGDGTNVATITSTTEFVHGATAEKDYAFGDPTTVNGYETINVTDTFPYPGGTPKALGSADSDYEFDNDQTFSCSSNPDDYINGAYSYQQTNRAEIVETGDYDEATVTVTCYAPVISKTTATYYERDWTWTIDKSADQTSLTLSVGQTFAVNYTVDPSATKTDSGFNVSGVITVGNPNPDADLVVTLADVFSDGTVPVITPDAGCVLVDGVLTVPAGGAATCDYAADVANADAGSNTATAKLNGISFVATEPYTFGAPDVETDECIAVTDSLQGVLDEEFCIDEKPPAAFTYSRNIGPYEICGDYTVDNTASFVTNDTSATGDDTWTVNVNVPCGTGCTLTQGYWKTHSSYGPAPYDDTWAQIGEDTLFFLSGMSYYDVLWTPPAGNAYYNLAHQYIAAELNFLNGASVPGDVQTAFNSATTLFNTYTPAQVGASKSIQRDFKKLVGTLDDYNNGLTGPGHCSEDSDSASEFERFEIYRSAARYLIVPQLRGR